MSLTHLSAAELARMLQQGEVSSLEITEAFVAAIEALEPSVGAFLRYDPQRALDAARQIDRRRAAGESLGSLAGLPVAVKDNLCERGQPTTCASQMLERFTPPYDATVVARLRGAGAILLGRTNMDEMAMGGSTEHSAFQTTHNPWNLDHSPGGSSGGAAAAMAARMTALSIGSDTGGSIRQPASYCGVVGIKPTYGRVSRYGLVAFASSLDQVGLLTGTVEDAALGLECIAGPDPLDSTCLDQTCPKFSDTVRQPLEGLRIGIAREHFVEGLDAEVEESLREALRVYESLGAKVVEVSLPHAKYAVATYYVIAPCEASSNLARYDGVHFGYRADVQEIATELAAERKKLVDEGHATATEDLDSVLVRMYRRSRSEAFGPEVQRRIMLGTYALSAGYYDAYYLKALKVRRLIRHDFDEVFRQVDVLAGPVTASPPFKIGANANDPLARYLLDLYTVSANLAGLPAMSLPCGVSSSGLPIGLHLHAPPLGEERLLRAAYMYEAARGAFPTPPLLREPTAEGGN